ncbi:hypothetical protein [Streptomyces sp. NPDC001642]|uniref:hypothetical protein n=1 Tax=Streptomyces sp. NPDC001642 TaxID=3154392 RepID=UPI00332DE5FF
MTDQDLFERERERGLAAGPEAVWQGFFEENPWIFGYGLNLVAGEPLDDGKLERITTGANISQVRGSAVALSCVPRHR